MFDFLGRMAVQHPWKIIAFWLLIAAAVGLTAPHWESRAQDDDIRFLPDRFASVRGYKLLEQAFPGEVYASRVVFALERTAAPLRPADFALADRLVDELTRLREAEPDLQIGKVVSHKDGLIGRRLTSADGHCTLIQVSLGTPYLALQTQATVDRIEQCMKEPLAQAGNDAPRLLTTGAAGVGRDLVRASGASLDQTTIATVILVVVILLLVYRAPLLALVPLLTIGLSVWVAVNLLALATLLPGVHLVSVSKVFAIVILYGAGTDYCLFLISRYREELTGTSTRALAMRRAVRAVGAALAASAGTVICGLSLMGFAEFAKVRCAGPAIAVALAVGLLASLTLTPALLRLLGRAVFWPGKAPKAEAWVAGRIGAPDDNAAAGRWDRAWDWISHRVVARPLLIWSLAVLTLLPLAIIGLDVTPTYRPTGELAPQSPSIVGMKAIQQRFTAGETGPLMLLLSAPVDWNTLEGKQVLGQVCAGLEKIDNVAEVRGLTQPLGRPLPNATVLKLLGNVSPALEQAQQSARTHYLATIAGPSGPRHVARLDIVMRTDPFDPVSVQTLEKIESYLQAELPQVPVPVGWIDAESYGSTVHSRDLAQVTESDRRRVNLLVLGGIFVILLVLINSVWLAGYLLATVLFSYFATLGATALMASFWFGTPLGQLDWRVPFFLFTILVAVGEDYNILLVARILQERDEHGNVEGTRRALSRTGGAITACGLIMAGTFATLMLAGLNTLVAIGFALAFGVLLDTFVVRPFLVPPFMMFMERLRRRPEAVVQGVKQPPPLRRAA